MLTRSEHRGHDELEKGDGKSRGGRAAASSSSAADFQLKKTASLYSNISAQRSFRRSSTGTHMAPEIGTLFDISGCRRARLKHIMGDISEGNEDQHDDEDASHELYRRAQPLEPCIAVRRLLGHVHFDVDGGILNLNNDTLDFDNTLVEVTKVPMLKKNACEISIAMITILRVVMNAGCILWEGKTALMHYMVGSELSDKMREASGWHSLHLPMMELFVTVKLMEGAAVVGMLSIVLWDAVCILFSSQERTSYYAMAAGHPDKKYHRLVRIWWEIYPELQNFSALRALEFVHPALIAQHFGQVMMARHEAARVILERFLRLDADIVTDEELLDSAARVLIACDHSSATKQEQYNLATHYLHTTPCAMAHEVFESPGLQKIAAGETENTVNVDTGALSLRWRLRLYTVTLFFQFVIMAVVCALAGWLSFLVKICFVSHVISNPTTSVCQSLLPMIVFLNQMVGIVSLRRLLIARVRAFAFGGCDGIVSNEERYLLDVYLAILQARVWSSTGLTHFQKLAVMVQLDDRDLQELMVEEDPLVKSDVVLSVKQHMSECGIVNSGRLLSWVRGSAPVEKKV